MALLKCPECGNSVSDKADTCPKCGYPIKENLEQEAKNSTVKEEKSLEEVTVKKTKPQNDDSEKKQTVEKKTKPLDKKKIGAIAVVGIVLVVAVIVIGGLGSNGNTESEDGQEQAITTQESMNTEATAEKTSDAHESVDAESAEDGEASEENKTVNGDAEQEPVVLMDEGDAYIEFRGILDDDDGYYLLNLYIENKSKEDFNVEISGLNADKSQIPSGDGVAEVVAGSNYITSTGYNYMINKEDLKAYGITEIGSLSFDLIVEKKDYSSVLHQNHVNLTLENK